MRITQQIMSLLGVESITSVGARYRTLSSGTFWDALLPSVNPNQHAQCPLSRLLWLQALCRVSKLPQALQEHLLQPKPADEPRGVPALADCGLPSGLRRTLQSQFNASQQAAIASALGGRQQFTLIQVCMHALMPLSGQLRL